MVAQGKQNKFMLLNDKQFLFAESVAKLINYAVSIGFKVTFGEVYRPKETATIYEKQGIGIKDSLHTKRLAVDLMLFRNGVYLKSSESYRSLGDFWESL